MHDSCCEMFFAFFFVTEPFAKHPFGDSHELRAWITFIELSFDGDFGATTIAANGVTAVRAWIGHRVAAEPAYLPVPSTI